MQFDLSFLLFIDNVIIMLFLFIIPPFSPLATVLYNINQINVTITIAKFNCITVPCNTKTRWLEINLVLCYEHDNILPERYVCLKAKYPQNIR